MKRPLLTLAGLCFFLLYSCGDGGKNAAEESAIGTAIITLDDGQELEFKPTFNTSTLQANKLGIGLSNSLNGMLVYIMIMSPEPLAEGSHDGYISLNQIGKEIIAEKYNSHYYTNRETGEKGSSNLRITSLQNDQVEGTFSGTLYSESGKKITIKEGAFSIDIDTQL